MNELSWQLVVLVLGTLGIGCYTANSMLKTWLFRPKENNNPQEPLMCTQQFDLADIVIQNIKIQNQKKHSDRKQPVSPNSTDACLKKEINFFFAGSKKLDTERNIYHGAVGRQQTKWKDKGLLIYGVSYQNFEHEVVDEGHQGKYNDFIQNCTDAIFFVLNGNVGGITKEEFNLAMNTFKKKGTPKIFIYSKTNDVSNSSVEELREIIRKEKQYWQDYTNDINLNLQIEKDMAEVIEKINDAISK